jgi:hypothetical protein
MAVLVGWTLSAVASTTVALARIVGPSMRVGPLPKDVTGAGGRQHGGRGGVAGGGRPHQ